jgi:hypothetical protein
MKKEKRFVLRDMSVLGNLQSLLRDTIENWVLQGNPPLLVVIKKFKEDRTHAQNARMWPMIEMLIENHIVCELTDTQLSDVGWHDWLRCKYGFTHGVRMIPVPSEAEEPWQYIEAPAPQPTADGKPGRMNKQEFSTYMERIEDELAIHGLTFTEENQP